MSFKIPSKLLLAAMAIFTNGCEMNSGSQDEADIKSNLKSYSDASEQAIQPIASHFDQLKDLDWLVGNWINEDENQTVNISYKWEENKNFLVQHFISKILDQKELEGKQIIGWDPSKKKMISWIFDSEGGFGEGSWSKQDINWYANITFTLSDGLKASAMHIYTKVDENTYTFTSKNRDVDGKLLPNIGPFKIVRKPKDNP